MTTEQALKLADEYEQRGVISTSAKALIQLAKEFRALANLRTESPNVITGEK